jgi:MFS family permease
MGEPTSNSIQVTTLMSLTFLAAATLVLKIGLTKVWTDQFLMECRALTKIILCAIFIRLGVEVGSSHVLNLTRETGGFLFSALTLTWFTINLRSNKDQEDRWLGMFNCIGTGTYSVIFALSGGWISEHWIGPFLSLASLAFLATIYAYRTDKEKSDGVLEGILSVGIMAVSIPLFYRQLHKLFGLNEVASTTAAMTMTAILMIVCGFNFKERHLRYWALTLFSITLLKVVAIDLANLDSFIRVGILMLLGIAMIGGGYWYILWQKSNTQPRQEKTEPSAPTNSIE